MKRTIIAAIAATLAMPAIAGSEIEIHDAYARSAGANALAGAAFFMLANTGDEDDTLIGVRSDAAKKVELHTHIANDEGVMRMVQIEGGIPVAAGSEHMLKRGGDHVMFMGLTDGFENGETLDVTLVFEKAGEVAVEITVDNDRKPGEAGMGAMNHGNMGASN
ncbi:copper chaperone PCu(A)C [Maritimibacter sp. UBA3975]|uniref:copper chaperone PCu(A)C n=1 Tax=Maritimibacter sp. UBA3975 TaxID=1946833 RepID=UPI000C0A83B5|nr:copper chaperone PCu(A)C [Maritimibacter sp. UBA3975]MAM62801.1 copper-binding protein [Maritimibacter sp.]|tara:strand:+ start:9272 stop:9760 length:489 start_codon:yes stop_codon:yes gene_type:complete